MYQLFFTIIFIIIIFIYLYLNYNNIIYIHNNFGDKLLIYKDNNNIIKSNLLNKLITNMYILRDYLYDNIDNYSEFKEYIIQLKNNFNKERTIIYETDPKSNLRSYSLNKGEELSICMKDKNTNTLYDLNLLTYVAIHEMSHFACPEIGHGLLFQKIFNKFILIAIDIGLYVKEDYNKNPINYCGLLLNSSIV